MHASSGAMVLLPLNLIVRMCAPTFHTHGIWFFFFFFFFTTTLVSREFEEKRFIITFLLHATRVMSGASSKTSLEYRSLHNVIFDKNYIHKPEQNVGHYHMHLYHKKYKTGSHDKNLIASSITIHLNNLRQNFSQMVNVTATFSHIHSSPKVSDPIN